MVVLQMNATESFLLVLVMGALIGLANGLLIVQGRRADYPRRSRPCSCSPDCN